MTRHSRELRTWKYDKEYGFLSFARNLSNKCGKELLDTAVKAGLDALKAASKKLVHKAAEVTAELIRDKITSKFVKTKPVVDENSKNIEEIVIPPEKKTRNISRISNK